VLTKIIVPGANPLRYFVCIIDCINNVRNELYERSCFFVITPHGICGRFRKCEKDYLVLLFYIREGNITNIRCVCEYIRRINL
jgi:hypothetical protein